MTPAQKKLLAAVREHGGCWDRYLRVVASGDAHNSTTVLACFRWGWLNTDGSRVEISQKGLSAIISEDKQP
jgi:hypothetical protein